MRFMQETKSQSLDTPYAHSHEQHKLDMDGDDMTERSHSLPGITQVSRDKGMLQFVVGFSVFYIHTAISLLVSRGGCSMAQASMLTPQCLVCTSVIVGRTEKYPIK